MRKLILAAWVSMSAAASTARAQPADPSGPISRPAACTVDIVRAPDDVRDVVEGWIGSELVCSVALEVRIVKTDGGLYLIARDDRGRAYERIVPDAESAGVLIASWAADDSVAHAAPTPAPPRPVRVAAETAPLAPPGDAVIAAAAPARVGSVRRLTVMASLDVTDASVLGMRAQVDVWEHRGWLVGTALAAEHSIGSFAVGYDYRRDGVQGSAYVGRRFTIGGWSITPSVGFGASVTHYEETTPFGLTSGAELKRFGEASIMVSRALTHRVELTAASVGRWYPVAVHDPQDLDLSLLGGLGWSL